MKFYIFNTISKYHIKIYFSRLFTDKESTEIMVVWCDGYFFLLAESIMSVLMLHAPIKPA